MRTSLVAAVCLMLLGGAGCRRAADEAPPANASPRAVQAPRQAKTPATGTPPEAQPAPAREPSAAKGLDALADALGLGSSNAPPIPANLIPGGDCPAVGADADAEMAAQAAAPVPLKPGLTLAELWRPTAQEEYECLTQVTAVRRDSIDVSIDCKYPKRPGPLHLRICRADLRAARMLHTAVGLVTTIDADGNMVPETFVGSTRFSLSIGEFEELKRTGAAGHHYVQLGAAAGERLAWEAKGTLRVAGAGKTELTVNNATVEVPVVHAAGDADLFMHGKWVKGHVRTAILDDGRFPLLIDYVHATAAASEPEFRVHFVKVSFPGTMAEQLAEERRIAVYGIYFDFNSDRIRRESEPVLKELAEALTANPGWTLRIEGHTDNVGGDAYNLDLSRRRGDSVRRTLVERYGIGGDRLSAAGFGASAPKDTNDTPEGRARNRRVELVRQ